MLRIAAIAGVRVGGRYGKLAFVGSLRPTCGSAGHFCNIRVTNK